MARRYLAAVLILGAIGVSVMLAGRSLPPTTIEAAVATTLRDAGAPSEGVRVTNGHCVPAYETCLRYIADVEVTGQDALGRLACTAAWEGCTLWMAELGIQRIPVPRVVPPHPWVVHLEIQVRRLDAWLCEVWRATKL